jgi:hypothetical protein
MIESLLALLPGTLIHRLRLGADESSRNSIYRAAQNKIRYKGQQRCGEEQLKRVDESVNDELVDRIEGRGDQERGAHILPAAMQQLPTVVSVCECGPKISRPPAALRPSIRRAQQ